MTFPTSTLPDLAPSVFRLTQWVLVGPWNATYKEVIHNADR
jgi:hypothetical protein